MDSIQLEKINKYVNIGKEEGADIKVGGNITMVETGGCYFEPTIFKNVKFGLIFFSIILLRLAIIFLLI